MFIIEEVKNNKSQQWKVNWLKTFCRCICIFTERKLCIRALLCLPPTFRPWLIRQESPPTLWLSQQLWRGRTQPWHQPSTLERLAYVTEASGTEGDGAILPQNPDTEPPPFLASWPCSHVVGNLVSCLRDQLRLLLPVPASQVDLDEWK